MVFAFDPRKLVDDEQKLKKEEVVDAVDKQLSYDELVEKHETALTTSSF